MIFIKKLVQYLSLFFLMAFYIAALEGIYVGNITGGLIMLIILLLLNYWILKWMSKYPVSYPGLYFLNGLLTIISFIFIIYLLIFITGRRTFGEGVSYSILTLGLLSAVFWWNFNILEVLRNKKGTPQRFQKKSFKKRRM
ncbi:hypothetical protein [Bacillus sp. REN16]|uniref:hypothetical protein n=1 Tax=Bacillus sp. REN16 TaxID=2887296 RepID=UPI001E3BD828|nr:hypothetical protein [Bacillus sp. REN16]MCC3356971.1 hypothetical protein [Bacillus sp. REN16]